MLMCVEKMCCKDGWKFLTCDGINVGATFTNLN